MKLSIKDKYFFGETISDVVKRLNVLVRDTYDDMQKVKTGVLESLPTATQDNRGQIVIVPSGGTDKVYVCRKNGANFEWREISWV